MIGTFPKAALWASVVAFAALSFAGAARAAPTRHAGRGAANCARAYVYAYSPVYAYRFLQDEVFNDKSISYIGAFNKIRNYQRLNTPEDTMFTPNVDTPYTRVWLDLRAEPMVLTLPKITPENRYYVMQATSLDHYNLDFSGTRTIGQDGGSIVYVGPRYSGPIPNGVGRVVVSPTDFVYLQGRILVFNPDDMKNVAALQDGITLKTLSETLGQPKAKAAEKFELKPWTNDDEVLRSVKTLDYLAYLLPIFRFTRRKSSNCCNASPGSGSSRARPSRWTADRPRRRRDRGRREAGRRRRRQGYRGRHIEQGAARLQGGTRLRLSQPGGRRRGRHFRQFAC